MARKITTEIFIKEMKEIHGDKYDYSKVNYTKCDEKVCIICPKHGEFWQLPSNHRHGDGCPMCKHEKHSIGIDEFIKRSKEKFGDKYDYSKVEWKGKKYKVILICPIHGEFEITPESHLNSKTGCPKCKVSHVTLVDGKNRKEMREYHIWKNIKTRVANPNLSYAEHYSGRGITCCKEWMDSFEKFYEDMGPCPEGYTIDRIDNDGNYCKENCRWATMTTQSRNRGEFNKVFTYNGETHVLKEWAQIFNIKYTTLYSRIYRYNLSFEEAIQKDPYKRLLEFNGQNHTLKEWCEIYNIEYSVVVNRIDKHKWTLEEALTTPKGVRRNK